MIQHLVLAIYGRVNSRKIFQQHLFVFVSHKISCQIGIIKICIKYEWIERIWVKFHLRLFHPIRIDITNFRPIRRRQHLTCTHAQFVLVGWVTECGLVWKYSDIFTDFPEIIFSVFVISLFPQGTRKRFWVIITWEVRKAHQYRISWS